MRGIPEGNKGGTNLCISVSQLDLERENKRKIGREKKKMWRKIHDGENIGKLSLKFRDRNKSSRTKF